MTALKVRRALSRSAKKYIRRLLKENPRAAVLVSAAFLERRLITLLTDVIAPSTNNGRVKLRALLDSRFTIGPLLELAKSWGIVSSKQKETFGVLLAERNNLAHKYRLWKKFNERETIAYGKSWKPSCESVIHFLDKTG